MCLLGQGVGPDYSQAFYWHGKAATQGSISSQIILGQMYAYGWGTAQDYKQAFMWSSLAVANGEKGAVEIRDFVAGKLTQEQFDELNKFH